MSRKTVFAFLSAGLLTLLLIVGGGFVSSAQSQDCADTDNDGVCNEADNCVEVPNPGQRDDNLDGYGNICDADVDNDCSTGGGDIAAIQANWGAAGLSQYDVDESGAVGGGDIAAVKAAFGAAPGPSGLACAACPGSGSCGG